jgi:demethoxyubiquinone hydroxylase (CLK1/Coq7/Cat5 family)
VRGLDNLHQPCTLVAGKGEVGIVDEEARAVVIEMRDRWTRHADTVEKYDTEIAYTMRLGVHHLDLALQSQDKLCAAEHISTAMHLISRVRSALRDLRDTMH